MRSDGSVLSLPRIGTAARACGLALLFAMHAMAAGATTDDLPIASGKLKPSGAYLSHHDGNTLTVLSDGAVLVYGHRHLSAPDAAPKLWDPNKRGWRRLALAPECASPARHLHTATAMPDGKVLIAGGVCDMPKMADDHTPREAHAALSLWDAASRQWLPAPSLQQARVHHSASLMPDGSVLIVGGESDPRLSAARGEPVLASVEQYGSGRITLQAPLAVARAKHTATVLADGSVLVVGGFDDTGRAIAAAELWSSGTRSWRRLPNLRTARHGHTATRLADGRVLIAGGIDIDGQPLPSVEIWDPLHQAWTAGPDLPIPLHGHAAALLASGHVLVAGGAWIASHSRPIPWAWTWHPAGGEWNVAGHTTPSSETELSSGITLLPRPDGSAMVFTAATIMRWEPLTQHSVNIAPLWQSRPSAAALSDGRVMFVGREAGDVGNGLPIARIWDPARDAWIAAGSLSKRTWMYESTIELPSGRVIHVGIDPDRALDCEAWEPGGNSWHGCGSHLLEYISEWRVQLGLLPDGRAFAIANKHEILVLDETNRVWTPWRAEWSTEGMAYGVPIRSERPLLRIFDPANGRWIELNDAAARFWRTFGGSQSPSLLWDGKLGLWTYVFLKHKMGRDAQFLPDGCAISTHPLAVFSPVSGKVTPLIDPGIGIHAAEAEMVVLRDGTVVAAGRSAGAKDLGAGFFHRKASCDGFERQAGDDAYIAGGLVNDEPVVAASAGASVPAPAARPPWHERALQLLMERRWLLLACIGPVLGYLVLRRVGRRVRIGPSWALRSLVYGLCLIFVVPAIWSYVRFDRTITSRACEEDPKACLDPRSGILKPLASAQGGADGESSIPCRLVGVWSSRQGGLVHRIELKDDGTYAMEPSQWGAGNPNGYTGHWVVQGRNMVWRHNRGPSDLDVNPMLPESDTRFTLVEGNGTRTIYELIRAVPSQRCKP